MASDRMWSHRRSGKSCPIFLLTNQNKRYTAEIGCVWLATPIALPPSFGIHLREPDGKWGQKRIAFPVDSWVQRGTNVKDNI